MTDATIRRTAPLSDQPAAISQLIEPTLAELAGPGAAPVSVALDYGVAVAAGELLSIEAAVERMTRTLVFANVRVLNAQGALAAQGSAVFRRPQQAATAA